MATTRLIPMHRVKGKSFGQSITARIEYATNADKTDQGTLVAAYHCDPKTAVKEMMISQKMHELITKKEESGKNDVLLYQIRQSFKPGEVTPDVALEIGRELALRFTKGQHQFVMATHVDHAHIHNHIVFNAISIDCLHKFRNYYGTSDTIRILSDQLCREHGLSIVETPNPNHDHYGKWLGNKKPIRWNERIRLHMDLALSQKPGDYLSFIALLAELGLEYREGKNPAVRMVGQTRFTTLRAVGEGYFEDDLQAVIRGERIHAPKAARYHAKRTCKTMLIIDIQRMLREDKGPGFSRWAKVQNLKQMAKTLNYLLDSHLSDKKAIDQLVRHTAIEYDQLTTELKKIEAAFDIEARAEYGNADDDVHQEKLSTLHDRRHALRTERSALRKAYQEMRIHQENVMQIFRARNPIDVTGSHLKNRNDHSL